MPQDCPGKGVAGLDSISQHGTRPFTACSVYSACFFVCFMGLMTMTCSAAARFISGSNDGVYVPVHLWRFQKIFNWLVFKIISLLQVSSVVMVRLLKQGKQIGCSEVSQSRFTKEVIVIPSWISKGREWSLQSFTNMYTYTCQQVKVAKLQTYSEKCSSKRMGEALNELMKPMHGFVWWSMHIHAAQEDQGLSLLVVMWSNGHNSLFRPGSYY